MKKSLDVFRGLLTPSILLLFIVGVLVLYTLSGMVEKEEMTQLEIRISNTLKMIDGAGNVRVVIRTVKQSRQGSSSGIYMGTEEIPCGALVVAEGGDDPLVRMELTNALCALLGLQAYQVEVIGMIRGERI